MSGKSSARAAVIGILISIVVTVIIFKYTESEITWSVLRRANWIYLLLAFLMQVSFWLLWAFRLKLLTNYLGYKVSYFHSLEITMASMFTAAITPSSAGGEPVRVKMLSDRDVDVGTSAFIVLAERILDSMFFSSALPVFLIITGFSTSFGFKIAVVFTTLLAIFIYMLFRIFRNEASIDRFSKILYRLVKWFNEEKAENYSSVFSRELRRFREATIQMLSNSLSGIFVLYILTLILWSAGFMVPSFILLSLGYDPYFLYSYTAQLIIVIVSLVPLTPGSSGIAEVSMAYLYSNFVDTNILGVLVALWRIITYHANIFFGALFVNYSLIKSRILKSKSVN
ncbi:MULTISPECIES: UPF0104 family protein [unclassified Archaeoglobus]|uniref:UPF0104 family protein n=1 Tax=unclassified Archaeoglobus TaxID=2643606 RepID=UPI0025BC3B4B|nr:MULTISPECIES: UPF0104 family protein [unclassified Archaeoglobus]